MHRASPMVPREVFFTKGVGKHRTRLQSFELALRHAGIEKCNLVRVSSIFPPACKIVTRSRGLAILTAPLNSTRRSPRPLRLRAEAGFLVVTIGSFFNRPHGTADS